MIGKNQNQMAKKFEEAMLEKEESERRPYDASEHFRYPKIYHLDREETDGILDGLVVVQEKIDGANAQIWFRDNWIRCGSRSHELKDGFNGFVDYVQSNENIKSLLTAHPEYRLYGEWLVRHTIHYIETAYKQFYMYDIRLSDGTWLHPVEVRDIALAYKIPHPQIFGVFDHPTRDSINKMLDSSKSDIGEKMEGVVIKNPKYINKFGERRYGKVVSQEFKEDNSIVFGSNNRQSDTYSEMRIVNKFMTLPRVQKVINKIQPLVEERLDFKHTPRISGTAYHDMLTEEIWEINRDGGKIDFKKLAMLSQKKAAQIYKDILTGTSSVADITPK